MAAEVPATGGNDALLTVIGAVVVAAIGGAVTVIVAAMNGRNKVSPSPPSPEPTAMGDMPFRDYVIGKLAVHDRRLDDGDERDEVQDRRLDQIERAVDIDNIEWRHQ